MSIQAIPDMRSNGRRMIEPPAWIDRAVALFDGGMLLTEIHAAIPETGSLGAVRYWLGRMGLRRGLAESCTIFHGRAVEQIAFPYDAKRADPAIIAAGTATLDRCIARIEAQNAADLANGGSVFTTRPR